MPEASPERDGSEIRVHPDSWGPSLDAWPYPPAYENNKGDPAEGEVVDPTTADGVSAKKEE